MESLYITLLGIGGTLVILFILFSIGKFFRKWGWFDPFEGSGNDSTWVADIISGFVALIFSGAFILAIIMIGFAMYNFGNAIYNTLT